jgi:hypothetical protein
MLPSIVASSLAACRLDCSVGASETPFRRVAASTPIEASELLEAATASTAV